MARGLEDLATAELIRRCLAGDDFAWYHLHQRHWPYLLRSVRYWLAERGRDAALAEQLATNAWTSLWGPKDGCKGGRLARYKPERGHFSAFLHRLARKAVERWLTRRRTEIQAGPLPSVGVVDRRQTVWGENITLEDFSRTLTNQPKNYFWQVLLGLGRGAVTTYSAANLRKLRQRVLEKWQAFMEAPG